MGEHRIVHEDVFITFLHSVCLSSSPPLLYASSDAWLQTASSFCLGQLNIDGLSAILNVYEYILGFNT